MKHWVRSFQDTVLQFMEVRHLAKQVLNRNTAHYRILQVLQHKNGEEKWTELEVSIVEQLFDYMALVKQYFSHSFRTEPQRENKKGIGTLQHHPTSIQKVWQGNYVLLHSKNIQWRLAGKLAVGVIKSSKKINEEIWPSSILVDLSRVPRITLSSLISLFSSYSLKVYIRRMMSLCNRVCTKQGICNSVTPDYVCYTV